MNNSLGMNMFEKLSSHTTIMMGSRSSNTQWDDDYFVTHFFNTSHTPYQRPGLLSTTTHADALLQAYFGGFVDPESIKMSMLAIFSQMTVQSGSYHLFPDAVFPKISQHQFAPVSFTKSGGYCMRPLESLVRVRDTQNQFLDCERRASIVLRSQINGCVYNSSPWYNN